MKIKKEKKEWKGKKREVVDMKQRGKSIETNLTPPLLSLLPFQRESTLCLLMWTMRGLLLRGANVDFVSTFLRASDEPRVSGNIASVAHLFFGESDVGLLGERGEKGRRISGFLIFFFFFN